MRLARRGIAASIARIFSSNSQHRLPPPPPSSRKRLVLESLESRILLSADPLAAGSLLVFDGAVDQDLLDQFSSSDVVVLDQSRDGLEQISAALAAHDGDISALHIVSHGASGSLALGSTTLDAVSLESHQAQLQAWADALSADADILFYGCEVAADDAGIAFVEELSRLTGADVGASNDLTGSSELGGDWVLEYATGAIEADTLTASIDDVLATVNYDAATDTLTFTADAGQADVVTLNVGGSNVLRINVGGGDTIVLAGDALGNPNFTLSGGTQLDINRTGAPVSPFNILLGDLNDTLTVNPSGFNGAVSLTVLGEAGNDAVSLFLNSPAALTISAETINVNANIDTTGSQTYSGAVIINTGVTLSTGAAGTISFDGSIAAGANALTLSAVEINLPASANSVSGTGTLTLQPITDAAPIVVGGTADSSAAALDITDADIAALSGGFGSILIGRATGNGAITVDASGASFGDTLTVRAPTAGGTIRVDGALDTTADPGVAAITLDATAITLNAGLVTSGGAITIADPVVLGTPATLTLDTTNAGAVAGGANITLSSVNDDAASSTLVLLGTLAIPSGTVTLNTATQASSLTLGSGTLTGTGNVTVTGLTTWTGGTMSGTGATNTDGGLNISGTTIKQLIGGRTLNTAGTTNWSGSNVNNSAELFIQSGASINNNGTWNDQHNFTVRMLNNASTGGSFDNFGTYTKSGTGETQVSVAFNNTGAVNVNAGRLELIGGGTHTGSFSGAGTLEFNGGTHALNAGSSIATTNATFSAGTANINGTYTVSGTTAVSGGTANFLSVPTNLGAVFNVSSGTANLGNASVALTTLIVSGGTFTGTGTVSISGLTTWTGGTMSGAGTTNTDGGLNISGSATKQLIGGRTLNTTGTTNWSGSTGANSGEIFIQSGASINNNGTWNDQHNFTVRMLNNGGAGSFDNFGTYTKTGTGETQIGIAFNNTAGAGPNVVNVNAGTLALSGGGTQTGSFSGTGTLEFGGGTHTLSATSSIVMTNATFSGGTANINGTYTVSGTTAVSGGTANFLSLPTNLGAVLNVSSGAANLGAANDDLTTLTVSGGTLTSNGTLTAVAATISGGTFTGTGTVSISGLTTWTGGTMSGAGTTNTDGGLNISGSATKQLIGGRTLNTTGTTNWSGSTGANSGEIFIQSGASINNNGTWNDQHNFTVRMLNNGSTGGSFDNFGTYTKSGAGETQISVAFNNTGGAAPAVNVSGGRLVLSGGGTSTGGFATVVGTTLEFGGGAYQLNNAAAVSSLGTLEVSAGSLSTSGTLTTSGLLRLIAGTLDAGGTVNATTYEQTGGTLAGPGTLNVSGQSTWTAGTMTGNGDTNTNGGLNIGTIGTKVLSGGRTLNTAATTNWGGSISNFNGEILISGGANIVNSGTWNDQHNFVVRMLDNVAGGSFENHGTYHKSGAGETSIGVGFDNTSVVNAGAGTLSLDGGGTNSGAFNIAAGAALEFGGGTHALQAGSSVSGAGTARFDGGTVNVAGTYNVTGTTAVSGATANFTGTVVDVGAVTISNGTANFSSGELIQASTLSLSGGGTLAGSDTVTVSGLSTWAGGTMTGSGDTNTNGLNISTNALKSLSGGRTLSTAATTSWGGSTSNLNGEIFLSGGAKIVNSGTWNDQHAFIVRMVNNLGGGSFENNGTYNKSGAGETQIGVEFDNANLVIASAGTLSLDGGGVSSGTFSTAGGVLEFGGGVHQLQATSSVTSAGTVRFDAGTVNVGGTYSVSGTTAVRGSTANFTGTVLAVGALQLSNGTANFSSGELIGAGTLDLTGGTLAGTDTVNVSGQSTWSSGTMSGTGQTNTNGGLNITSNANKNLLGGRVLHTVGITNWSGNTATFNNEILMAGGSSINNSGNWNDQNAFTTAIFTSGGVNAFNNAGTYTKSGIAETQVSVGFDNSGTVQVQAGMLNISGALVQTGTIDLASGATLRKLGGFANAEGAVISGRGTIEVGTGALTNSGTILPGSSPGLLSITGNLALTSTSTIAFELGGTTRGTQYDAINVSGAASLNGTANVIHLGGFVPSSTDAFVAIQAGVRTGTFAVVNTPAGHDYTTVYAADHVTFHLASNDPPVALNDSFSVAEDATLTIAGPGVLLNDTDPDLNPLTAILGAGPGHGTLTFNADGSFTYTPNANFFGSDSFTYRANDGQLTSDLATVALTISPVNDAPVANNDSATTNEDTTVNVNVRANDTDVDFNSVTVSQFTQGAHGTVSLNANGTLAYTPNLNFFGSDTFTYRVRDTALAESNEATVTVTVNPVNDAPDAVNDSHTIDEDTVLTGALTNVLANDTDVDNAALTAALVNDVSHGTLTLNTDGTFTYTPDADFFGIDSFTYQASDGHLVDIATATITVQPVDDAPDANDDVYATDEDIALSANVLANDTDADSVLTAAILLADVSHGTLVFNGNGSFAYTPDANYFGADSFTYRASDGALLSDTATVAITVNPVNDAPVAADDDYATNEDTALIVAMPGVLANDTDIDSSDLEALIATGPGHGSLVFNTDGSFTYTPHANYFGPDSFTYTLSDGTLSDTGLVSITVNAVNDAPVATDDAYTTNEDTPLVVAGPGVLGNDTDIDSADLQALLQTGPAHGSLTLNADGSFSYTPNANYFGADSFTYRTRDTALAESNTATVSISVNAVNDAPVAVDDSYTTNEDTALLVALPGVLGNDTDIDSADLEALLQTVPAHGSLTLHADGSFTYTPDANFHGTDGFTYRVSDDDLSDIGEVSITVNAVNDAPVAGDDAYTTDEDTPLVVAMPGVLGNDTDIDSVTLEAALQSGPAHGTLALNADGSFTYTPDANYFGSDSFTYRVSDDELSDIGLVSITVDPVNDAPLAADDSYTADEDTPLVVAIPGVLANDTDIDSADLEALLETGPAHGSLTLNADGSFTYTPNANFNGADSFTYRVSDDDLSDTGLVTITVNAVNDAPVAQDDSYSVDEDGVLSLAMPGVLGNDTDVDLDALNAALESGPAHGNLTLNADGSFTYTPDANFNGTDGFTYRVSDDELSDIGAVTITINAVNDGPVAADDSYATGEDSALIVALPGVLANDTDIDSADLEALLQTGPAHGSLALNADGSFTYTPDANFNGTDGFTYRASDDELSDIGAVTITVNAVNDAPVAVDDSYATGEDTPLIVAAPGVLANDTDVDSVDLEALLETGPAHGTLVLNSDGSFTYTPSATFNGTDSFTYRVSDDDLSDIGLVTITVGAVNNAPVAADDSYATGEDTPLIVAMPGVLTNDTDIDSADLEALLETGPAHGSLTLNADGSFTYIPDANFNGTDGFTYRVSDDDLFDIGAVSITVNAVNDAPAAVDDSYATDEDTPLIVAAAGVLVNDGDIDSADLEALLESGPAHGTLALNTDGSFTYTPNANYFGGDSFTYRVSDGELSDIGLATITVNSVNDAPVAQDDSYSVDEDAVLTVTMPGVLANDTDIDSADLEALLETGPAHGSLTLNTDGSFTYTADANFNGTDGFTYRVSDDDLSDIGAVTIAVNAVNDAPVAQDDSYSVAEDAVLTVAMPGVLANDTDIDSADLEALLVSGPAHGSLTLNADGSFTYTPAADFNGTDGFTYRVSDDDLFDIGTVSITVNAVNDAPVAQDDSYSVAEDAVLTVAMPGVLANDTDIDSADLEALLVSGPAHGSLTLNADGSFTYAPEADFNGADGFTYRVSDDDLSDIGQVTITVNAVNDEPLAADDSFTTDEDTVLTVSLPGVLSNDSDVDLDALNAALESGPAHGSVTLNADGSFVYTPDAHYFGGDSFTYRVSDGALWDTGLVSITVNAVNDAPVAHGDAAATDEDTAVTVNVRGNDADIDGDTLTVVDATDGLHGTVVVNSDGTVTYTPEANFYGSDVFSYVVSDGEEIDDALVFVTVDPVNDDPDAFDDTATTSEDVPVTVAVLANDDDVDGDALTVNAITQGAHGTVAINTDGTVTYTPNAGFDGSDSFTYTVNDGQGGTDTATVEVTVTEAGGNGAPVFTEIADRTVSEGTEVRFTVSATDPDAGDTLDYMAADLPAGATFDPVAREFRWIPADDASATVTFTVLDGHGGSDTMDVVLTATNVAATVDAGADQVVGLQKDKDDGDDDDGLPGGGRKVATVELESTFNDLGTADTHTAVINWGDGTVTGGAVSESPFGPVGSTAGANGTVEGSHTYSKAGVYTVTVTVTDDNGGVRSDTMVITVQKPDKHLKGNSDKYEVMENAVLQVNAGTGVLSNDTGTGTLVARLVDRPEHGSLTLNANGSFSYVPDADFHGKDVFWYEFNNGSSVSRLVKVELKVKDAPKVDWAACAGWGGSGGGKHSNFVDFLFKLAAKRG